MRVYRVPISEGYAKHVGVYPRIPTVLVDFDDAKARNLRRDQQWVQYDEDSKSPELRDNIPPGGRVLHSSHLQISELTLVAQDAGQAPTPAATLDGFLDAVRREYERATSKFVSSEASAVALMEEVGEVAKALLDESSQRVRDEAVQVAVMAARIALQGDPTLGAYRQRSGAGRHPE